MVFFNNLEMENRLLFTVHFFLLRYVVIATRWMQDIMEHLSCMQLNHTWYATWPHIFTSQSRAWLVLRLLSVFRVCMYVSALITHTIITSYSLLPCDLDFSSLDGCFVQLLWVVQHSYEFEMDTEKQRQRRHEDARLVEMPEASSYSWCLQST